MQIYLKLKNYIKQVYQFLETPQKQHNTDLIFTHTHTLFKLIWSFVVNYSDNLFRTSKAGSIKGFSRPLIQAWPLCSRAQAAGWNKDSGIRTEGGYLEVTILHKHLQPLRGRPARSTGQPAITAWPVHPRSAASALKCQVQKPCSRGAHWRG